MELSRLIEDTLINNKKALEINDDTIKTLPDEIFKLKDLEKLILHTSRLEKIPGGIIALTGLKEIAIWHSKIRELPESIGMLSNLSKLTVWYGKIEKLPDSFGQLKNLKHLNIQGNHLKELPHSFSKLRKLEKLELHLNHLREIPPTVFSLTNLKTLNLYGNKIKKIPKEIMGLINLRELGLAQTELKDIPCELRTLKYLSSIDLNYNKFELPNAILEKDAKTILDYYFNYFVNKDENVLPEEMDGEKWNNLIERVNRASSSSGKWKLFEEIAGLWKNGIIDKTDVELFLDETKRLNWDYNEFNHDLWLLSSKYKLFPFEDVFYEMLEETGKRHFAGSALEDMSANGKAVKALKSKKVEVREWGANFLNQRFWDDQVKAIVEFNVGAVIELLKDSNVDVRRNAVELLGKYGDKSLSKYLAPLIGDGAVGVRRFAVKSLGLLAATAFENDLLKCLDDDDDYVRANAVISLGQIGSKKSLPRILDMLKVEGYLVPSAIVKTLKALKAKECYEDLFPLLFDKSKYHAVLNLFEEWKKPITYNVLEKLLKTNTRDVNWVIVNAVVRMGPECQLNEVRSLLESDDENIRRYGVRMLGKWNRQGSNFDLMPFKNDPSRFVRDEVQHYLRSRECWDTTGVVLMSWNLDRMSIPEFVISLSHIRWFGNQGKSHKNDKNVVRIKSFDEWEGPESEMGGGYSDEIYVYYETLFENDSIPYDDVKDLWDHVSDKAFNAAVKYSEFYDDEADHYYAPNACVNDAAFIAATICCYKLARIEIPEGLKTIWMYMHDGHWPCGITSDAQQLLIVC